MAASILDVPIASVDQTNQSHNPPIARIVNGTPTTAFPSVGMVGDNRGSFCSGTLIAPQYVLTAAHCAVGVGNTSGRFTLGSNTFGTSQVFVHPNYNENLIGSDSANDIAIYKLSSPVTNVEPSPIFRGIPQVGQLLTLVGFGGGGTGNTGTDGTFGTKRVGTTPIDAVTPKMIRWNFDNNNEANTAPGDSGGPAFLTVGGVYYVAGVTSGGEQANAGKGDVSFDTRVDAYAAWIDSIVGGVTPPPAAVISVQASDAAAAETLAGQTANTGTYVISRTGSLTAPLTVNLAWSGTATNGSDYSNRGTTATIPAGATSVTISIVPIDDTLVENAETAVLTLGSGAGYSIDASRASASVTIADNDRAPTTNNDMFANRIAISGQSVSVTGNNTTATRETREPNILGVSGGKSVWWTWVAPANGTVIISTAGSNFDTTLGVYRGTAVRSLTSVAVNDDDPTLSSALTSRVSFQAVAGTSYQILVDGYNGASGSIALSLQQTTNRILPRSLSGGDTTFATMMVDSSRMTNPQRNARRIDRVFSDSMSDLFN